MRTNGEGVARARDGDTEEERDVDSYTGCGLNESVGRGDDE